MEVEDDVTTESVDSIEYIGKHGKQRPATTEPVDSIEFIGKPAAKISSSFSSQSQKSKKTVKFNDLIDTEVNEALFEYDQIIGDFSDVGTESVSLNTTTSEASDSSTERSLEGESDGSEELGGKVMSEVIGKSEIDDEESIEQMLDDIHKTHQMSQEDLER